MVDQELIDQLRAMEERICERIGRMEAKLLAELQALRKALAAIAPLDQDLDTEKPPASRRKPN